MQILSRSLRFVLCVCVTVLKLRYIGLILLFCITGSGNGKVCHHVEVLEQQVHMLPWMHYG